MTRLYSLGLGKQTILHLVHPPTNTWTISVPPLTDSNYIPIGFRWKFGDGWGMPTPSALADFTWGCFIGSPIRGWQWPQRYQVRISGNWMLPYLEKNLCRCVKNLWREDYPGSCLWARNPVSSILIKEMLGGPNTQTRKRHVVLEADRTVWPRERQCWRPQKLKETGTAFSPRGSEGSTALLPRWFQPRKTECRLLAPRLWQRRDHCPKSTSLCNWL